MEPSDSAADNSSADAAAGPADGSTTVDDPEETIDGISVDQWLADDGIEVTDDEATVEVGPSPADEDDADATVVMSSIPLPPQLPTLGDPADLDAEDEANEATEDQSAPEAVEAAEAEEADEDSNAGDGEQAAEADEDSNAGDGEQPTGSDAPADEQDGEESSEGDNDPEESSEGENDPEGDDDSDATAVLPTSPEEPTAEMPAAAIAAARAGASTDPVTEPAAPSTPATDPATAEPVVVRDRSPLRPLLVVGGILVGAYLVVAAAWAVDTANHRGQAMRGVHIDDIDVGGSDRDEIDSALSALTDRLADEDLAVTVGEVTVETDPVTLGAIPDRETLADEALEARRGGLLPLRPLTWAAGLFGRETIPASYVVDPVVARRGAEEVLAPELDEPVEPELAFDGDELALVPGSAGVTFDPETVIERMPDAIADGTPYELDVPAEDADPTIDDEEIQALADELNGSTSEPIAVRVLDKEVSISPNSQRSWIRLDTSGGDPEWTVDEAEALAELQPLFPVLGSEDQQARFQIVDGDPIIIPASETVVCCAEGAADTLAATISAPFPVASDDSDDTDDDEEPELRVAELEPEITGFDEGVEELESLGITELVSTFTTNHACCQNRVTNIQRFADLTQGVVIRPGEEFSLNGFVGRRTRENGFVADGAIAQGVIEPQVGGGISQYATTFFNASFFAGIEFLEYQSHSIYISRYPRGREATISWPRPDLKVLNNTPYGILVWNEYTDTSITVSFYSTKHREVEALDRKRSSDRQCRIDITPRRITFDDGTVEEDSVFALYRPGEGFDCNGNSTRPEPEPEPEPEPQPEPEPEPEPDSGNDDEVLP